MQTIAGSSARQVRLYLQQYRNGTVPNCMHRTVSSFVMKNFIDSGLFSSYVRNVKKHENLSTKAVVFQRDTGTF